MFQLRTHPDRQSQSWWVGAPVTIEGITPDVFLPAYGNTHCNGRFRFEHVTDVFAFHVFEQGSGVFELDGATHEITPGQMVLVRPNVHARYYDRPDHPWHYRWFTLDGKRVANALAEAGVSEDKAVFDGSWNDRFADMFTRIENRYMEETVSPVVSTALGWEALSVIAGAYSGASPDLANSLSNRAQFIMQQEYHSGLQVEELARRLRVSRATLFRQFRAAFGQSPKSYLDELRLAQARELLQRGTSSVKEVAYACGYQCARYFSRAYYKRFGEAPSRTRR